MISLKKLLQLSPEDRRLLIRASLLLALVRLGLWLLPFQTQKRLLDLLDRRRYPPPEAASPIPGRIAWAVDLAARHIPRASCLTQALAAKALLAKAGYSSHLHLGVCKGERGTLQAHAWLRSQDKTLVGHTDLPYAPLPDLPLSEA